MYLVILVTLTAFYKVLETSSSLCVIGILENPPNMSLYPQATVLTQQEQDPRKGPRPLGYPELCQYEVDCGGGEGAAQCRQEPQGEHRHVLAVLHADLLALKLEGVSCLTLTAA